MEDFQIHLAGTNWPRSPHPHCRKIKSFQSLVQLAKLSLISSLLTPDLLPSRAGQEDDQPNLPPYRLPMATEYGAGGKFVLIDSFRQVRTTTVTEEKRGKMENNYRQWKLPVQSGIVVPAYGIVKNAIKWWQAWLKTMSSFRRRHRAAARCVYVSDQMTLHADLHRSWREEEPQPPGCPFISHTMTTTLERWLKPAAPVQQATTRPQELAASRWDADDEDDDLDEGLLLAVMEAAEQECPGFDAEAGSRYVYPTNLPIRDYQFNITNTALFNNTLVALPTGLGKTLVAAVVMYNYQRWYPTKKILFMAPTKPLVLQQIDACKDIMRLPVTECCTMTGREQLHNILLKCTWEELDKFKCLEAKCHEKPEKSGLEPTAPNRLADRKHCALSTQLYRLSQIPIYM